MAWELCLHPDVAKQLAEFPAELRPQFEAALKKLESDPKKYAHTPTMPYAWKGPLWDFKVHHKDGRWHNITVFFLFDDDPESRRFTIHEMNVITPYYGDNPPRPSSESTGTFELGPPHEPGDK